MTIRDYDLRAGGRRIGDMLRDGNISTLSDGQFDERCLARYPHLLQLIESCWLALDELSGDPYEGRISNARVMGRAMELLRRNYGLDAPRGWVPVLRILRAGDRAAPLNSSTDDLPPDEW